jgi:hypothetical protein
VAKGNKIDCKSVSGYIFLIASGPIMWSLCKQTTVALSSTEAELTSLSEATKQVLYIRRLLSQLLNINNAVLVLHNNNQSALHLVTQPLHLFHLCMKHYNIKLFHLCNTIAHGHIALHYCLTEIMPVDILTKALLIMHFTELKVLLGLETLDA